MSSLMSRDVSRSHAQIRTSASEEKRSTPAPPRLQSGSTVEPRRLYFGSATALCQLHHGATAEPLRLYAGSMTGSEVAPPGATTALLRLHQGLLQRTDQHGLDGLLLAPALLGGDGTK